jgi:TetR/AcrR family tetracycline transcriptional repressor
MRLTRKMIVEVARDLVNESGLEALTIRRLGERLGVKGPALYRHFTDKQDIVTAIAASLFIGEGNPRPIDRWDDWLESNARIHRKRILACRDGAKIMAMAKPNLGERGEVLLKPLIDGGFDRRQAIYASHLVGRFVIGWTTSEQEFEGLTPPFETHADAEAAFDFALRAIIAGLRVVQLAMQLGRPAAAEEPERLVPPETSSAERS